MWKRTLKLSRPKRSTQDSLEQPPDKIPSKMHISLKRSRALPFTETLPLKKSFNLPGKIHIKRNSSSKNSKGIGLILTGQYKLKRPDYRYRSFQFQYKRESGTKWMFQYDPPPQDSSFHFKTHDMFVEYYSIIDRVFFEGKERGDLIAIFGTDHDSRGILRIYNLRAKKLFLSLNYFSKNFQPKQDYYDSYIEIEAVQVRRDDHILMFFRKLSYHELVNRFRCTVIMSEPTESHFTLHQFWDFQRSTRRGEVLENVTSLDGFVIMIFFLTFFT